MKLKIPSRPNLTYLIQMAYFMSGLILQQRRAKKTQPIFQNKIDKGGFD